MWIVDDDVMPGSRFLQQLSHIAGVRTEACVPPYTWRRFSLLLYRIWTFLFLLYYCLLC